MPLFRDQLNRLVDVPSVPQKIISLVPSQTELLFYMGLGKRIAGITKFCIHPKESVRHITKIGGTKQLNIDAIHQLQPDLIIANKEENERIQIEELMAHYPVWVSDVNDLQSALEMIKGIGEVTACKQQACNLVSAISEEFVTLETSRAYLRTAYFIWRNPYMAAGAGTFITDMMRRCGLQNVFEEDRYPEITPEMLVQADPEVILLSSEPYPFSDKHIAEFKTILPKAKILLADGEMFSWYGNRLLYSPAYFRELMGKLI